MSFDCGVFVNCEICICALFVGGKCEGGASGVATILLELGQCFGGVEACGSHGAKWRAGDLWPFDGAAAVYNVVQIWVHAFGIHRFLPHTVFRV